MYGCQSLIFWLPFHERISPQSSTICDVSMAIVFARLSLIAPCPSAPLNLLPTPPHLIRSQFRHALHGIKCDAKIKFWRARASSGREWKDYEDAVQEKDLARALHFLESLEEGLPSEDLQQRRSQLSEQDITLVTTSNVRTPPAPSLQPGINWMILDACLNAEDMNLVARTYEFLQRRGFLPSFGKFKNIVAEGPKNVTPADLKASTGLEASNLSPKKWGLSGSSVPILLASLAGFSFLADNGIDFRPKLAIILGLGLLDSVYLGGAGLGQVLSLWPPYRRRVLVHEAGHILTAYLLGCPVRGVILEPLQAVQIGIQGQAGTQFWDETLESELNRGELSSASFDRYCMVLFAGIAAEALIYGEAEGGESDENLFKAVVSLLRPPWSLSQMSNQARWAVQQSYILLKDHKNVHRAAVKALEKSSSLGFIIRKIEDAMAASQ